MYYIYKELAYLAALKAANRLSQSNTIPDETTWESFPHHVHFPMQQNYLQNNAFAGGRPLPPIQCCFPKTPRDQAFFWIHKNIAFRGRGRGKNRYSYDFSKNAVQVYNFLNSFVQDCSPVKFMLEWRGFSRFLSNQIITQKLSTFATKKLWKSCEFVKKFVSGSLRNRETPGASLICFFEQCSASEHNCVENFPGDIWLRIAVVDP